MSRVEPQKLWWTAKELAASGLPELPGTERGINLLADRFGWRATPGCARRKPGRGGGWQYHWSILPLAARRKLLKDSADTPPARLDRGEAWALFDRQSASAKTRAEARLRAIQMAEALHTSGATHVQAIAEAARQAECSTRSLYNWLEMIAGVAPEDRLAYLVPRNRIGARTASKSTCSKAFMDHLKGLYLRLEQPSFRECYRLAEKKAEAEGWDILEERTAKRHLEAEVPRVSRVFAREGVAGLMRCFPAQIRDRSNMTAMEGVNADCHKIDVFVRWPDGTINRPQIVAFQDIYSGKILSWRVDNDPNKVMVMAAFGELVEKHGIPRHCLFDNGHEFANKWMTAGTRTRFRFKIRDDDPLGVLPLMGISVHWATPAHGQAKPVERAFGDFASNIAKHPRFHGAYVGNRPDAKPENYGSRAIPAETFLEVLDEGIREHNARPGRLSHTAQGRSFDETFAESYAKAPIARATEDQRRLWLMGQQSCRLRRDNGQLRLYGNYYHSDWMSQMAGKPVVSRFDPEDLHSGVHLYTPEGEYLGFAECQQAVGFFDLVGAKEEARRKRRILRAEKALLKAHRPIGIEEIAASMVTEVAPDQPDLTAKVVKPVFATARRMLQATPKDPELDAERDALILSMPQRQEAPQRPVGEFRPSNDPDERFRQAQAILARSEARQPIGRAEAAWVAGYVESGEYQGLLAVAESFGIGGAG